MGIDIEIKDKNITIAGKGLKGLRKPDKELYLGNSGTTMRILPGILAGQTFGATLTGDESLSKRPMDRIIEPLRKMAVDMLVEAKNVAPLLFHDAGPGCVGGSCGEGSFTCGKTEEVRQKFFDIDETIGKNLDVKT